MIQLCYISTARPHVDQAAVDEILAKSRANNKRAGVTGLLLFNGKRFLQLLEGPPGQVAATYARIERDDRHYAVVKLSKREIATREFGEWDMSYQRFAGERSRVDMIDQVTALTQAASPNVKALFTSYAAI